MKNVLFLVLAVLFFALAYYIYWVVAYENGLTEAMPRSRSALPRAAVPPPSELMSFIQQWQPYLSALSSIGGILSFIFQVRIWMRGRA